MQDYNVLKDLHKQSHKKLLMLSIKQKQKNKKFKQIGLNRYKNIFNQVQNVFQYLQLDLKKNTVIIYKL